MDDLRELFHWYVPETDLNDENHRWYALVNVAVFVAIILGLLLFVLFCKLKHRWLVNAKCAFCNCAVKVWRAKLYWWFCNRCQRVNGYPKNSLEQTDSSSVEEIQESKDDNIAFEFSNIRNNKIPSPSNQRNRISYSKNDLNVSATTWHSPKLFQNRENDSIVNEDENNAEAETSFQKIKNKITEMLSIDHGIGKLSSNDKVDCSANLKGNSVCLPGEMSNLRKIHMQLILDDVNRRYELLNAEKMLHAKMKQMKEMEKSLRHAKKDAIVRDNRCFPIRRRNTFFERSFNHSIASPNILNNKEMDLKKDAATARLATLEAHLTELRDMHANEITLLKSQIENKSSILNKIENLKFGVVEFYNKVQEDQFSSLMGKLPFTDTQELTFEVPNQISHNNHESGYLSETEATKARTEAMSVIVEENDEIMSPHHIQVLKRTFDRFNQHDNKPRGSHARIVKPIRAGQRPAAKVLLGGAPQ